MERKPIEKILIVGAGSSGWMTAAYLNKALNAQGRNIEISLIESSDIDTIGVGEATVPMLQGFFQFLGIPEEVWMQKCNATFKMAIRFVNWYNNAPDDYYWHTFGAPAGTRGPQLNLAQYWLYDHLNGYTDLSFAKYMHEAVYACELKKSPKPAFSQNNRNQPINYAFHLDAGLLAKLLRDYSKANGVKHLIGTVKEIMNDEYGNISHVMTHDGKKLHAHLFIDCTGFSSLFIDKHMGIEYESYEKYLLCDRAIAAGTMYPKDDPYNDSKGGINSYTTAKAMKYGWTWHTPLVTRDGNGYVYCSAFVNETDAEEEFVHDIQNNGELTTPRPLHFKTGKYKESWCKNCIAIGLSAGFIEPMESTGLALIQIGINTLLQYFPDQSYPQILERKYNEEMTQFYENIRDFICLHYTLTQREDTPFWKTIKYDTPVPDTLKEKLEEWRELWDDNRERFTMFGPFNYFSILSGMKYLPENHLPIISTYQKEAAQNRKQSVVSRGLHATNQLPSHSEYFKQLRRIKQFQEEAF